VLLVDAWEADDLDRWEGLVLDHLDEMEPDLELLEKVLLYFTRTGQEHDRRGAWAEELRRQVDGLPADAREPHEEVLEAVTVERAAPRTPAPHRSVDLLVFLEGAPGGVLFVDGERVGRLASMVAVPAGAHLFEVRCQDQLVGRGPVDVHERGGRMIVTLHDLPSFVPSSSLEERQELCR
jgi:hypothetical protein